LKELIASLRGEGTTFVVARLKGRMQRMLRDVELLDLVGELRVYPTVRDAVEAVRVIREGA
jgi:hypothetical protein